VDGVETRAGYPLLSGEGVVRAIDLVGGTPEEDQAVAERRRLSRHGQVDDP
jgi:hypothetical protein